MNRGRAKDFFAILRDKGFDIPSSAVVLDLGCGSGVGVKELRENGYEAYGCDISLSWLRKNPETQNLESQGIIKLIRAQPYELPFSRDTFDFVISYQVFEHVKDYPATLSEVFRVLKPGGATLNIFPSRYRILEPHGGIPLGSLIQTYSWIRLWTALGIHGRQKGGGLSAREIADIRYEFLNNATNYLTKKEIHEHFARYFSDVSFCEVEALKHSPAGLHSYTRMLHTLSPSLTSWAFGAFGSRTVLAVKY